MIRSVLLLTGSMVVTGCGDGANHSPADEPKVVAGAGVFTGRAGENSYHVDVACSHLDKDYFTFLSDNTDASDTNGDGIIISGMQNGNKLVFTIIDHGRKYSTGNLARFEKSASGTSGNGVLFEDPGGRSLDTKFSVKCE